MSTESLTRRKVGVGFRCVSTGRRPGGCRVTKTVHLVLPGSDRAACGVKMFSPKPASLEADMCCRCRILESMAERKISAELDRDTESL